MCYFYFIFCMCDFQQLHIDMNVSLLLFIFGFCLTSLFFMRLLRVMLVPQRAPQENLWGIA